MNLTSGRKQVAGFLFLLVFAIQNGWSQEYRLVYKFAKGQTMNFKRSYRVQEEAQSLPNGKSVTVAEITYALRVDDVGSNGEARMTLSLQSVEKTVDGMQDSTVQDESLRQATIPMVMSKRGQVLNYTLPRNIGSGAANFLDAFMLDFNVEGSIPGMMQEVGSTWHENLSLQLPYAQAIVSLTTDMKSIFVRVENYRGVDCARIEHSGILLSNGAKSGFLQGISYFGYAAGKRIKHSTEIDLSLLVPAKEGRMQMRIKQSRTVDALN